jgi:hypothetical protein
MRNKLCTQIVRMLSLLTIASLLVTILSIIPTHRVLGLGIVGTITRPGFQPRALALDESRNRLFVFDKSTAKVFIYNATTLQELGSVTTNLADSLSMVVDESRGKLYAGYFGPGVTVTDGIAVINIVNSTLIKYLPSGGYTFLTKDEDRDVVYASSNGSVTQIQVATDTQTQIAGIWGNVYTGMAVNPVTHELFVSNWSQNDGNLFVVNPTTLAIAATIPNMNGFGVAVNWTKNKAYVTYCQPAGYEALCIYDRDTGSVKRFRTGNDGSQPLVFNPLVNRLYADTEVNAVATIVDGSTDAFTNISIISALTAVGVHNSTDNVYYAGASATYVMEGSTGTIVAEFPVGASCSVCTSAIVVGQTSGLVYIINETSTGSVTVIRDTFPPGPLPYPWLGGVSVTSDRKVVAVARPHVGKEVASYDGFASGSLSAYVPMLFKNTYGTYSAALYVQNVNAGNIAHITVKFYDSNGALKCTMTDTIDPQAFKPYWVPTVTCDTGSLPDGWVGGAVVTSDQPIVAVGRPHVGTEVMTYDGFAEGSLTSYIPMLFKGAYDGSYNSAFYIQNVNAGNTASITIKYYDSNGELKCTKADTINPLASKGYWVPSATCDTGSLPPGWVGGVIVTSNQPIVGVGRPHIGTQVTTYNGSTAGSFSSYIPMLFKAAYGGTYNAAFYLQNTNASNQANVTIKYYSSTGVLDCTKADTIAPLASKGYWVPTASCDSGSLPDGWVGGAVVTSDQPIMGVGRPHIGAQVTTYNGFTAGSVNSFLPMLFKSAFDGTYNAAFYIQNTENSDAAITIKFYDTSGKLTCTRQDTVAALSTVGYWMPTVTCIRN